MNGDEPAFERDRPHQIEKERLAGPVLTDHKPDRRTAVGDPVDVTEESGDFVGASDLDVLLADAGHDAGAQGLDDRVAIAGTDAGGGADG